MGYRNVEPFTLSGLSAEEYRALLDEYGLKASARHVDVGTPTEPRHIDAILEENRILGIKYFGSGGTPNFATEAEWIAYAEYLDAVGEQARKAGQTLMVHNHNWEFQRVFGDMTAYDILLANTDPRNVVFQLDLYWATNGGGRPGRGARAVRQADRAVPRQGHGCRDVPRPHRDRRRGDHRLPADLRRGRRHRAYYVVEHDPRFGDPTFDPFEAAGDGVRLPRLRDVLTVEH